ncbi:hypothetical protein LY71_12138 [Geodermatophilus tzadiensis]|uniref:Uncharacterized protein n=1 Tax=Geodermatophilus tzadiensis TaxID=1137988 RepID=A0A2T0T138_9ACTN|nr:hypothetical protein LY71_12138 [Geodermatophilus tzadiensis]
MTIVVDSSAVVALLLGECRQFPFPASRSRSAMS